MNRNKTNIYFTINIIDNLFESTKGKISSDIKKSSFQFSGIDERDLKYAHVGKEIIGNSIDP
jgi:hypothetical protein